MFGDKKIIAIIPARGGSKRIPKKNIVPIAGKPMIHWTIDAATKCKYIDKVLVSTDNFEIQTISEQYGLDVPFLREEGADDYTPVSEATLVSLLQAEELWGGFDVVVQLMPNCPLRGEDVVQDAIEHYFSDNRSSQISFFKYGWMNPWWAHTLKNNIPVPLFEGSLKSRSQDLDELYCPTGSVWITTTKSLKLHKTFYSTGFKAHVVDWVSALDIDDADDLLMAEALFQLNPSSI